MKFKVLTLVVLALFFSTMAHAGMKKGSVGNKGTKRFTYIPNADGGSQISMIYDNAGSDIDIIVGTEIEGDEVLTCLGISTLKQFERCEFGADDGLEYTILVSSFRGSSGFRFYAGTMTDETVSVAGSAAARQSVLREEAGLDQKSLRLLEMARKLQKMKMK